MVLYVKEGALTLQPNRWLCFIHFSKLIIVFFCFLLFPKFLTIPLRNGQFSFSSYINNHYFHNVALRRCTNSDCANYECTNEGMNIDLIEFIDTPLRFKNRKLVVRKPKNKNNHFIDRTKIDVQLNTFYFTH